MVDQDLRAASHFAKDFCSHFESKVLRGAVAHVSQCGKRTFYTFGSLDADWLDASVVQCSFQDFDHFDAKSDLELVFEVSVVSGWFQGVMLDDLCIYALVHPDGNVLYRYYHDFADSKQNVTQDDALLVQPDSLLGLS